MGYAKPPFVQLTIDSHDDGSSLASILLAEAITYNDAVEDARVPSGSGDIRKM